MTAPVVLSPADWRHRRDTHHQHVEKLVGDYLRARARGEKHPVIDFLFTYYSARPAHIRRWHPGFGVVLADARRGSDAEMAAVAGDLAGYAGLRGYTRTADGVTVDPAFAAERRDILRSTVELLTATASRPARLGCFGLHEWAMVYRTDRPRHSVPLRLGAAGTDAVVRSMPLRCTHFDAFRFFTDAARPLNDTELTRRSAPAHEQPGCLHATMDLYRLCITLTPLIASDVTLQAFELALRARELDMRASPYDLRALGYEPVTVETAAGRAEYVREQSRIAECGGILRTQLADRCRELLDTR
ncbi:3-methyladenine DNA glycosylase [Gordonia sp. NPDC003425]